MISGHDNALLCGKHKGELSDYVPRNVGVFQGGPISAHLFIIYDVSPMEEYSNDLSNNNISRNTLGIINNKLGNKWTPGQLSGNSTNDNLCINNENYKSSIHLHKCDHTLFADDTLLDIPNTDLIYPKLQIYNNNAKTINLLYIGEKFTYL